MSHTLSKNPRAIFVFALFAIILCFQLISTLLRNSATADEPSFLSYGRQVLEKHTTRRFEPFHNSKMAINALQALPSVVMGNLPPPTFGERVEDPSALQWRTRVRGTIRKFATSPAIIAGRFVTVLFTLLLALYLYRWAFVIGGMPHAIMSLGLFAFCPLVLAHGNLITTDMPLTCMIFIAVYYFARFLDSPTRAAFFQSAVAMGLAQCCKFTALHLLPAFAIFAAWGFLLFPIPINGRGRGGGEKPFRFITTSALYLLVVWFIINTAFLWEGLLTPLRDFFPPDYPKTQGMLGSIPIPFSFGYFQGIVMSLRDDSQPYPDWLYFLGQHSKTPFSLYFPVALLLKTPLGSLALFALCLFIKPSRPWPARRLILATMLYFFAYFSLFHGHQIGLRFLLPIFPLAYLCIGGITQAQKFLQSRQLRATCWCLFSFSLLSSASYYPHYIPYFNELIGNRLNAYGYLGDSNLDWNQANGYKDQYLKDHPELHPIYDPTPTSQGIALVRANDVIGIQDPERLRWLRELHKPVGHIAHAWLIYNLDRKK